MEIHSGHTYVGGGRRPQAPRVKTGLLGAELPRDPQSRAYRGRERGLVVRPRPAWVVQAHADDAQVDPGVPLVRAKLVRPGEQSLRAAPIGTEAK